MEAFKVKTFTRSQSIAVQSALFAQGIRWVNYKDDKVDCELRCFFVNEKGELMHDGSNYEDFEKHPYKEIKMQEIAPSIAIDEKNLILQKHKNKIEKSMETKKMTKKQAQELVENTKFTVWSADEGLHKKLFEIVAIDEKKFNFAETKTKPKTKTKKRRNS